MCVTLGPAAIENTRVYGHVGTPDPDGNARHYVGYQNVVPASNEPNIMFLNFACMPGTLELIQAATHTRTMMDDITAELRSVNPIYPGRGLNTYGGAIIEQYGDYTTVRAENPADIVAVVGRMIESGSFQLNFTSRMQLNNMASYFADYKPGDSFLLMLLNGPVKPKYPVVVSYVPRDPSVITLPGLDGHDGQPPIIGAPVLRNFKVAFGISGVNLVHHVDYQDDLRNPSWAPSSVVGFFDNASRPNGDYTIPVNAVREGINGRRLAELLFADRL